MLDAVVEEFSHQIDALSQQALQQLNSLDRPPQLPLLTLTARFKRFVGAALLSDAPISLSGEHNYEYILKMASSYMPMSASDYMQLTWRRSLHLELLDTHLLLLASGIERCSVGVTFFAATSEANCPLMHQCLLMMSDARKSAIALHTTASSLPRKQP